MTSGAEFPTAAIDARRLCKLISTHFCLSVCLSGVKFQLANTEIPWRKTSFSSRLRNSALVLNLDLDPPP